MNRKEIHFEIDSNGNIKSTIRGIKGSTCSTIAEEFESLGRVEAQNHTNEFYESSPSHRVLLEMQKGPK